MVVVTVGHFLWQQQPVTVAVGLKIAPKLDPTGPENSNCEWLGATSCLIQVLHQKVNLVSMGFSSNSIHFYVKSIMMLKILRWTQVPRPSECNECLLLVFHELAAAVNMV
jgi:hypothetical protein